MSKVNENCLGLFSQGVTSTVKPKVPEPRYVASKLTTQVVSGPHRPPNATRGASSQARVDASPGPSTTGVHSPPSRGSFVVSPQRGSTGSSGAKPQMTQLATGDSSQLVMPPLLF
nr:unnamed protein product [Spirometra erinaceieuropaei]